MRVPLKELLEKLAVRHILTPYESAPWVHYDEDKGITCSAEVRMGPDGDELEAEIQFLYDEKDEDDETEDDDTKDEKGDEETGQKQKFYMRVRKAKEETWSPRSLLVNREDHVNELPEWEEKACALFQACIQAMQMDTLPEIDDLIEKHLRDDSYGGRSGRGRIGRKSPKVKPGQLLGMKQGGM